MKKNIPSAAVKAGILNTIAKSIYSDIRIKTREAVSNSMDNLASLFIITVDENTSTISFYDNGGGISPGRFKEIFMSIGYGQTRDKDTNSYFGLGLMSVLQLGNNAAIYSKCSNNKDINHYEIKTQKIFDPQVENDSVDSIKNFISVDVLESPREGLSILKDDIILKCTQGFLPDSFTEIILRDVHEINTFIREDFVKQLRKILPLKPNFGDDTIDFPDPPDPFFAHINDKTKLEDLKGKIFNNPDYCKTIDIYYGKTDSEEDYRKLTKYYPEFLSDVVFTEADIKIHISEDKSFALYFLISPQDINEPEPQSNDEEERLNETGFWVRNRNFLVKSADFFQKPGSRKKIVDEPLKTWIFGEVFHKDMTKMLVVTRDEYLWEDPGFRSFYDELKNFINPINKEYRDLWKRGKKVVEALVEPFSDVRKKKVFERFHEVLIESGILEDESKEEEFLDEISQEFTNPGIEDESAIIGKLLKKNKTDLILADDVESDIIVVISGKELSKEYIRERDPKTQKLILKISPKVFSSFHTNFMGKGFQVHYVLKSNEKADFSINTGKEVIYINLASQDLARFRLTFLEFIMIVKVAYMVSKDKDEMLRTTLDLIGTRKFIEKSSSCRPGEIFSALEDIFNRR